MAVVKRQDREIELWPPSSVEVKNEWSYTDTNLVCTGIGLPLTEQRVSSIGKSDR